MPFERVDPRARDQIRAAATILEAVRVVDDPEAFPVLPGLLGGQISYGMDLQPDDFYLYVPEGSVEPVGVLQVGLPSRDNLRLATLDLAVHPAHRGAEHRSMMLTEGLRLARTAGRTVLWLWAPVADLETAAFLGRFGFVPANCDARRHQGLGEVDQAEVERLWRQATEAAADYELVRLRPPLSRELLGELVGVTAAINDAPMGGLTFENEVFDLARLLDQQSAGLQRGDRRYRVVARHRASGELAGHTEVALHELQPQLAHQADTAVARVHRGHRLGLLLKIDMMRWLAEAEPQLTTVRTYNNADNDFMISVNEALGYRLNRLFTTYQLDLGAASSS